MESTIFSEIIIADVPKFGDSRRGSVKSFDAARLEKLGAEFECKEIMSLSSARGVLRGMHFQLAPKQNKLVTLERGKLFAAVADVRKNSTSFGKWMGIYMSEERPSAIFVPHGFALGTLALEDSAFLVMYDSPFSDQGSAGFRYDDPCVGISWPADGFTIDASEKDRRLPALKELIADLNNEK